eukprot:5176345-Pyramimonas_sp.AAC.1
MADSRGPGGPRTSGRPRAASPDWGCAGSAGVHRRALVVSPFEGLAFASGIPLQGPKDCRAP